MKNPVVWFFAFCLCIGGCRQQENNKALLQRDFYNTIWERFDYVSDTIVINSAKEFNLDMKISFTEDYPYNDFSMVFTVFDQNDNPYRAKGYKFNLKDEEGHWNVDKTDDCYTFVFPINKRLEINDPGKYRFVIEQKMPITPLVGVKNLVLSNNN